MSAVLALSLELLQEITSHVSNKDRKSLRLSCTRMKDAAESQLFTSLTINISRARRGEKPFPSLLESLANGSHIAEYVRKLCVTQFTYESSDKVAINSLLHLQRTLSPAISSLRLLRQVYWYISSAELLWTREVIFSALASLEHLCDLSVRLGGTSAHYCLQPAELFPFQRMRPLQRLSVAGPIYLEDIHNPIHALIAQSPDLQSLSLQCTPQSYVEGRASLNLTKILEADLPCLTELSIDNLEITPAFVDCCKVRLKNLSTLSVCSSTGQDLWPILTSERIFVSTLDVVALCPSLIKYLSTHPGLEQLRIGGYFEDVEGLEDTSDTFFNTILPHHANTLKHMTLRSSYRPCWYYEENHATAIARCFNLRTLAVSFPHIGDNFDLTTSLMKAASSLPLLTKAEIILPGLCCCVTPNYSSIIRAVTNFDLATASFHPNLQICVDRDYFRLSYSESERSFKFNSDTHPELSLPSLISPSRSEPFVPPLFTKERRMKKAMNKVKGVARKLKQTLRLN